MNEPQRNRVIIGWLLETIWVVLQIIGLIFFIPLPSSQSGRRGRILVVTDLLTSPLFYFRLRSTLIKEGYSVKFYYNFNPFRPLHEAARKLSRFMEKEGLHECVLVAHGVGGLLPLALPDEGRKRVYHLLALGSPYHGTTLFRYLSFIPAVADITSRSDFLLIHRMNALLFRDFSPFSAWVDQWIMPSSLNRFGQGRDLILDFPGRLNLVLHGETLRSVAEFLGHSHPTTAVEQAQLAMSAVVSQENETTANPKQKISPKATMPQPAKTSASTVKTKKSTLKIAKKTTKK